MTMLQYLANAAVAGMLALGTLAGSVGQIQVGARVATPVAQYCVPPQEDSDPRLYCYRQG